MAHPAAREGHCASLHSSQLAHRSQYYRPPFPPSAIFVYLGSATSPQAGPDQPPSQTRSPQKL
ncbi:hypothetical protein E2C01_079036 [Portunus trituberculatus]|uniref:Uncharacterized protein n=1 Tax=Portunus trituberculatus TaxID=210409 RepID=A0A5B7IQD0_PORTR|nr:hypothetical protein [Portunus trituberculatus]